VTGLEFALPAAGSGVLETVFQAEPPTSGKHYVVVAPLLVALLTAIATLLVRFSVRLQKVVSVAGILGYAVAVGLVIDAVLLPLGNSRTLTYQLSGWNAPFGITAVADPLSAFMLGVAAAVGVPALAFSVLYVDDFGQGLSYHPLYHFMFAGVSGAFLTGDIFNLFVWFEVMLMSSYVLVVFYSGPRHTRAALQYVVLNLLASGIMLVAIGGIYATMGTLNMADLARRLANPAPYFDSPDAAASALAVILGLSAILFAVFALKAGIVPFQFWVPAAYQAAPAPVSAVLAGVVKKVGIYAIIRLYFTVFSAADVAVELPFVGGRSVLAFYGPVLLVMGGASILLGGISAIDRDDLDVLLAYSSIGQVGFIVLPLAVAATVVGAAGTAEDFAGPAVAGPFESLAALAIAATLVYTVNHALAKSTLFMASGAIWAGAGTIDFRRLGGITERSPVLAGSVFVAGIALVGIPPVVGFFGKFLVFDTAVRAMGVPGIGTVGDVVGIGALALAVPGAILTIAYVSRAWSRGFWGVPGDAVEAPPAGMVAIVAVMALALVVVGVGFDPLLRAAGEAATAALDRQEYVQSVDPGTYQPTGGDGGGHGQVQSGAGRLEGVIRP
jgi:multicomponent Na+:H+ antiporter subunit D